MTESEQQAELGSMVQERREVKQRLNCTKNRLDRIRRTLEQSAFLITNLEHGVSDGFKFGEGSEFSVLPVRGVQGFEKEMPFPSRAEIAQALKTRDYLAKRLCELDELLELN